MNIVAQESFDPGLLLPKHQEFVPSILEKVSPTYG